MNDHPTLNQLIQRITAKHSLHTWSLIVSHFGALVHAGQVYSSQTQLREVLSPLGIKDTAIRVALLRLVNDGWLLREKRGRESFYQFTAWALQTSTTAANQIFLSTQPVECSSWQFALRTAVEPKLSQAELLQSGFGKLGDIGLLRAHYDWRDACDNRLVVSDAITLSAPIVEEQVHQIWAIDKLSIDYQWFIDVFSAFAALKHHLSYRLLLLHEYRRIVLKDPILPSSLVGDWSGEQARQLLRSHYFQSTAESNTAIAP
ncbi:MAG: hypothetical protein HWE20_07200 [Gammaproteobacteria bacterium]|nr:hypothetical protein [Gammaproteobacteria bacterium]